MATTDTAKAVASRLRELLASGGPEALMAEVLDHYGDKVTVSHDPPSPHDAVLEGAQLKAMSGAETAAVRKAIPDFRLDGPISDAGNTVTTDLTLTGTLGDGTPIRMHVETTYTLEDGQFVSVHAKADPAEGEGLMKAMLSAGFEIPQP